MYYLSQSRALVNKYDPRPELCEDMLKEYSHLFIFYDHMQPTPVAPSPPACCLLVCHLQCWHQLTHHPLKMAHLWAENDPPSTPTPPPTHNSDSYVPKIKIFLPSYLSILGVGTIGCYDSLQACSLFVMLRARVLQ